MIKTKRKSATFEELLANKLFALEIHISVCFVELCSISTVCSFGPAITRLPQQFGGTWIILGAQIAIW